MIIRSKAPLRLGLAGGGTDVSPYSDLFGGAVLNATISLYAYTTLIPSDNGKIIINLVNKGTTLTFESKQYIPADNEALIPLGVYNRIVKDFTHKPLSFEMSIFIDAPPGSGLGSSSTLAVSVLGAFTEWLKLPLGEYDIAHLAWEIERVDLDMKGGKQDQYAATFGGFNYMEFWNSNKVIVNPLRINPAWINELSNNLLLFFTGTSRLSSDIIAEQVVNVEKNARKQVEAMHRLKEQARQMKDAILTGEMDLIGDILAFGWKFKKEMAGGITNDLINGIYDMAINGGATGGKISGAGGGGYMVFYCPGVSRYNVAKALSNASGHVEPFEFTKNGLTTWTIGN